MHKRPEQTTIETRQYFQSIKLKRCQIISKGYRNLEKQRYAHKQDLGKRAGTNQKYKQDDRKHENFGR